MPSEVPVQGESKPELVQGSDYEKSLEDEKTAEHVNRTVDSSENLVYDDNDKEPELHARTYIALVAMFFLSLVQVVALQGPPAVLSFIGTDIHNTTADTWIPNALSLVQAVIAPVICSASDTFQARKYLLVGLPAISCIGAAIAPGSKSIGRLITAQVLIGFGFATTPLAYCVPSEILPRKWRPMAQAVVNVAAALGASIGPLMIGALTKSNPHLGWRNFYWIQMALWGLASIGTFIGYRPPTRHTRYDHLSLLQKLGRLDLPGFGLLTSGLTLFLVGMNLGGGLFKWTAAPVLATLIIGLIVLVAFGIYEWKFTKTGILHHDLFRGGKERGRSFAILLGLIFIEGLLLFAYVIFYPIMTTSLWETDPFLEVARGQPYWLVGGLSTVIYGYASTKLRSIRGPLFVGFFILTGSIVAFATLQPKDSTSAMIFSGLSGLGFGGPLVLIVAGVQLSTPHDLIATTTSIITSSRAIATAVFTAIYVTAFKNRLEKDLPEYVAEAAMHAGLPKTSLVMFVKALAGEDLAALKQIPGVTPAIIQAGVTGLKQAFADSIRVVFIIAAPFGAVACIACLFLADFKSSMNYHVDAPVEVLHAKHQENGSA